MENTMLLRKRRIVEGWNVESGSAMRNGAAPLFERVSSNVKVWAFFALGTVVLCALLVWSAFKIDKAYSTIQPRQIKERIGTYDDADHKEFLRTLVKRQKRQGLLITAQYLSEEEILITVPPDTASDDIQFLIRYAGIGSMNRFGMVPIVTVKTSSSPNGIADKLVATGTWSERDNDYNITFYKG